MSFIIRAVVVVILITLPLWAQSQVPARTPGSNDILRISSQTSFLDDSRQEFFDDFESGLAQWTGQWGLTEESSHSPTHSLTDSPGGNYASNQNVSESMVQGVDLSSFQSAELTYWTKYALETGFDYTYLEASTDGGTNWMNVRTFNGTQSTWRADTVDIGAFAGQANLKLRFRLTSDGALELDGFYVDDFQIEGGHEDLTPPLIVHTPDADTVSWNGDQVIMAEITDVSGVQDASLHYRVDGGSYVEVPYDSSSEDRYYYFTIPGQGAGAWTEYYFQATDGADPPNIGNSTDYAHIFGTILYYDDGDPEYIYQFAATNRIAVWFTIPEAQPLAALLFRFYRDDTHDIDTVDAYVWSDQAGYPFQVELGPLPLLAVNTLETPQAWTRIDLRSYALTVGTDFHGGCQFRSDLPVMLGDSPAVSNRTQVYTTSWVAATTDIHLRAVVGEFSDVPNLVSTEIPTTFSLLPAYPNPFNATCVIPFTMSRRDHVQLYIYNILGQKVMTLFDGMKDAGIHRLTWDAQNQASGIYFLQLTSVTEVSHQAQVTKVLLLK
jgi:hypothetical protein